MAFTEDFDPFFQDLGTTATLASGATVTGMFDAASVEILNAHSVGPVFMTPTAGVSGLAYGAALTIGGVGYAVRQNEPDGTGMTQLILERS